MTERWARRDPESVAEGESRYQHESARNALERGVDEVARCDCQHSRGSMWLNGSCAPQVGIRREGHQAMILNRPAQGEVIQVLKLIAG